ncbi:hypothetical protein H1164_01170 [Thermoactinomyces daqus]|uniref:SHOCT domain-containing protein n=1 Tax=Thermoactinomyces daqus TaxID=1329516 RepID=A0A7W1X7I1_9BACL|nr:hypothetical protein [Thermoactinomyces daqus]MBA4541518.1 hypothetical protein [Thermoactinomyces daqus]
MVLAANHDFHFFPLIFPFGFFCIVFATFLIFRIISFRRYGRCYCYNRFDGRLEAEEILKRRLINHEISEEEYLKLKEILRK